jgi:hypothetical protein
MPRKRGAIALVAGLVVLAAVIALVPAVAPVRPSSSPGGDEAIPGPASRPAPLEGPVVQEEFKPTAAREEGIEDAARRQSGGGRPANPDYDATFDTAVAQPAYADEHPRALFDEAHHNFHTTGGRYRPFAELVANDGYRVITNKKKFTRGLLATGDILVIANALGAEGMDQAGASNSAFTEAECDAVRDWVRAGGSLLLITDHTPFGSAAAPLARRFGVRMSDAYTADRQNSEGGDLVFTRKNKLLGDHPITAGRGDSERINRVKTFTGQSLQGPTGSVAILRLGKTAVDERDGRRIPAAGRAQGVAFAFGEGRVVVLSEAAALTAQGDGVSRFGMNVPGLDNRQLALNIMHWLSGLLEPRGGPQKRAK